MRDHGEHGLEGLPHSHEELLHKRHTSVERFRDDGGDGLEGFPQDRRQSRQGVSDHGRHRQQRDLGRPLDRLEGAAEVVVLHVVDLLESCRAVVGCGLDTRQHRQHAGLQILELCAEQGHAGRVAGEGVVHAVEGFDGVEERGLCGVSTCGEGREHFVGVEAEALEGFPARVAAVLRSDVELLDGVADLVDGEQAGVSALHEGADELVGAEAESRKLRAVLVQGVQQVAVFVCAVLRAHGDQAVGFLGVDAEVFHQGRRCPGALADIVVEHVPQVEAGGGCPLQSFAGQVAGLLRCSQTVSHVGEVIAEPLGVDVLDAFTERVQLVAGRPGCCRELIDGRVVLVAEVGQILPGLHDCLACCDCDAAHSAADGHGLPVDVFQLAGDIVQRLAE